MKTKKILAAILIVATLFAFAGCTGKNEDAVDKDQVNNAESVGEILLADFEEKANTNDDVVALAEEISKNAIIPFSSMAMEVEPGLLAGFGNAEITGFSKGASFGPLIGSIPFIAYIFELEDSENIESFIENLRANADLRWNICVEAEEMITGNVDNKVFFVMCEKEFAQEDLNQEEEF